MRGRLQRGSSWSFAAIVVESLLRCYARAFRYERGHAGHRKDGRVDESPRGSGHGEQHPDDHARHEVTDAIDEAEQPEAATPDSRVEQLGGVRAFTGCDQSRGSADRDEQPGEHAEVRGSELENRARGAEERDTAREHRATPTRSATAPAGYAKTAFAALWPAYRSTAMAAAWGRGVGLLARHRVRVRVERERDRAVPEAFRHDSCVRAAARSSVASVCLTS
jgi:hypothetical protein